AVRAEDREDIAFLKAFLCQTRGHAPNRVLELTISQNATGDTFDERRLVFEFSRRVEDEVGERYFRDADVRVWSAKDHSLQLRGSAMFIAHDASLEQPLTRKRRPPLPSK